MLEAANLVEVKNGWLAVSRDYTLAAFGPDRDSAEAELIRALALFRSGLDRYRLAANLT